MKVYKPLIIVSAIIVITIISACTPVDKILSKSDAFALTFINSDGKFIVVDIKTGKIVPPCSNRPNADYDACKRPEGFFKKGEVKTLSNAIDKHSNVGKSSVTKQINSRHLILITDWTGSHCETMDDIFLGEVYEICI